MLQGRNKVENQPEATRESVISGVLPHGLTFKTINEHLRKTKAPNVLEMFGFLSAKQYRSGVMVKDHGLISCQLVTQAFADYVVDSLQNSTTAPLDAFSYHASGTDNTAESNAQTALGAEVETRENGTQVEGASSNIYKTVATITYTATRSIVEHGLFSAATAGTMLDRSVFTAVPVIATDTIEFTYQLTVNAET